jgi:hypothetical protein
MGKRTPPWDGNVQALPDDWKQWPIEAKILLNQKLDALQKTEVTNFFGRDLHPGQQQIIREAKRFNVASCGRRFGKSVVGKYLVVETVLGGWPASWMAPSFRTLADEWRELKRILLPVTVEKSEQEHWLQVQSGGVLECWSLDNPDAPRGRKYKRVVLDEAAMIRDLGEVWQAVVEPTLVDLLGDAWFLSTPKGANFFRTMFRWGQDPLAYPEWMSWQMPSTTNTTIEHIAAEVQRKRLTTPERYFRQEYLAEFIDDAGGVFRKVKEAATATKQTHAIEGHQYVIGVDWGKLNDFTVLCVIDATLKQLVAIDRFNQIDYAVQIRRLMALAQRFKTKTLIPERNSIGEPLIEQLKREGYKVHPFTTTNASKAEVIDDLILAFEKGELTIIDDHTLIDELQAYEAERLPSGMLRYSAPEGYHDDCVISLALAWHGATLRKPAEDKTYSYSYVAY